MPGSKRKHEMLVERNTILCAVAVCVCVCIMSIQGNIKVNRDQIKFIFL